jgi:hypothetical protein
MATLAPLTYTKESNESDRQTAKKLGINRFTLDAGCAVSICLNGASWHA